MRRRRREVYLKLAFDERPAPVPPVSHSSDLDESGYYTDAGLQQEIENLLEADRFISNVTATLIWTHDLPTGADHG